MREQRKGLIFPLPSKDPDFLKAQEEAPAGEEFLAVLKGESEPVAANHDRPIEKESRLTVYLPASLHQKLRVRAVSQETTITEYVHALLERDLNN